MSLNFPMYLPFKGERTYSVVGYIGEVETYKDNKGYIDKKSGNIYICSKDEKPIHNDVPILFIDKSDKVINKKDVLNPQIQSVFKETSLYDLSVKHIADTTDENEELYNEEALADMNAATSVFIPTINEEDDPLKKLIKQVIISKKIDINRLKHKMPQKYGLTNMKSALVGKTKMSISNFNVWCELLGVNYEVIMSDNGSDNVDPLKSVIHYTNDTNQIIETRH